MSTRTQAILALVIASMLWSTAGAVAKILLRSFEPLPLGMLRLFLATVCLLPFVFKKKISNWRRTAVDLLPVSLFGAGNFILFLYGVERTTANAAAIIYTATPLLTAVVSRKALGESASRNMFVGIFVGLLGVFVILVLPLFEHEKVISGDILGNVLLFFAVFLWTAYNVGSRYLVTKKQYSPMVITSSMIGISFLCFLLLTLVTPPTDFLTPLFQGHNAALLVYFSIFVTVVTFLLHQWVIKYTSATTAVLTNYLIPVFGVGFNAVLLGETVTGGFIAGSILVLFGVFLATGTKLTKELRGVFLNKRS